MFEIVPENMIKTSISELKNAKEPIYIWGGLSVQEK